MAITISGDASTTRTNLGFGDVATLDVGTGANNVVQLDGSGNLPALNASTLTGVSGGLKQIQYSTTTSQYSFTNTSPVDDSALEVTITPSDSGNKIMIMFYDPIQNAVANNTHYFKITRTVGGVETNISGDVRQETGNTNFAPVSYQILDEPNTTSAVTYKRYFWTQYGTMLLSMNSSRRALLAMEIQ
jgi:hypothetical protein